MPSTAASSLFVISERHWALARGSLGDAFVSWSPAVLQQGCPLDWSLSPPRKLCPSSRLIFQTVFWHLKRYLSPDRDSSYTHTSTPLLSVPLLSSRDPPNAFRMWQMATHRGENECLSQEEVIWNALRGRKRKNDWEKYISFFVAFSNFSNFPTGISQRKSFGIRGKGFGMMTDDFKSQGNQRVSNGI